MDPNSALHNGPADQSDKQQEEVYHHITASWWAGSIGIMMLAFAIIRWTRVFFLQYKTKEGSQEPALVGRLVAATRSSRRFLLPAMPGFTSRGHAITVLLYTILSLTVLFIGIPWHIADSYFQVLQTFGDRTGWLSFLNLALITFFALRHSPLSFLTGYSYERLIVLHRIAGYATIFWAVLHTILYIIHLYEQGTPWFIFGRYEVIVGDVATLAMLVILGTALVLPRMPYEAFYWIHIILFVVILVTLGFHPRGPLAFGSVVVIICTAAFWLVDLAWRLVQLFRYSIGNSASITLLPGGGLRVVMHKAPKGLVCGAHCSLWIPSLRLLETHPLAIISTEPLEFVLGSYGGFTSSMQKAAQKKQTFWASVHGPYGVAPDFSGADRAILIAGGTGASFTFGVAKDMLRKAEGSTKARIDFIWVVRRGEMLNWYDKELKQFSGSPNVRILIYQSTLTQNGSTHTSTTAVDKAIANAATLETTTISETDVEKTLPNSGVSSPSTSHLCIQSGRPDIVKIIEDAVAEADPQHRLAVAACGPETLMKLTRQTVARNTNPEGPSMELQCEEYSW